MIQKFLEGRGPRSKWGIDLIYYGLEGNVRGKLTAINICLGENYQIRARFNRPGTNKSYLRLERRVYVEGI